MQRWGEQCSGQGRADRTIADGKGENSSKTLPEVSTSTFPLSPFAVTNISFCPSESSGIIHSQPGHQLSRSESNYSNLVRITPAQARTQADGRWFQQTTPPDHASAGFL